MALLGLLLLTLFCGEIQASSVHHIVNGELAEQCEFPHIAFLYIKRATTTMGCGGSLIDDTHVVTAAHCVYGYIKSVHALFGSLDMRSMTDIIRVSNYTAHQDFHKTKFSIQNDVAVLKLSRPVNFSRCRKSIRLVKPAEKIHGDKCIVAGWGKINFNSGPSFLLRRTDVPIMERNVCTGKIRGITIQNICAGDGSYMGKSACKGDSGGPLMCKSAVDGETVLVGLVSYGWTCREGFGVYTSVSYFHQWITDHAG